MAADNRTEQATPRRKQKARERGQVVRSRELPSALALFAALLIVSWKSGNWGQQWHDLFSRALDAAVNQEISADTALLGLTGTVVIRWLLPVLALAWVVATVSMVAQGGLVAAPVALSPQWSRLGVASNVKKLFSLGGLSQQLKSLLPFAVIAYLCVSILRRDWGQILHASGASVHAALPWALERCFEVAWKAALVLLVWSGADYLLQWFHFERGLRMSKQEVRDEMKEQVGNPAVRGRIRRLQRDARRRRMMADIPRATVVVTNPTEYAVALEYRPEMAAPVVLAKGRNLLARKIKEIARWNNVPIVENVPLAQALYKSVDVGQTIPAKLYEAVAEILAFIYRSQGRWAADGAAAGN